MERTFIHLNNGWNAEPNAPEPKVRVERQDIILYFWLNFMIYSHITEGDRGFLRFKECERYRLGSTNDEGWHRGQCRYSKIAPEWGEFYEITGDDPLKFSPEDWIVLPEAASGRRHFLFYFRDNTFECIAADWHFEPTSENALFRLNFSK
ncbi:MAG TPA: hypothetical protein VFN26_07540 [Candidatus Acidoferrum sp.]|nr:hypothetical protein [Candidatus Acidoferrum sp.]